MICNRANKVIFHDELDAKIALASRVWKDKGEIRHYPCTNHWHLTSQEKNVLPAGILSQERQQTKVA